MTMNPFKAGSSAYVAYYATVEDRIPAVARFDRAQCEAALKLPDLQKTVERALHARLRHLERVTMVLHFTDHGQDFLRWELDRAGKVIGCEPFQARIWCRSKVWQPDLLRAGDLVHFYDREDGELRHIKYPLERVLHQKGGAA